MMLNRMNVLQRRRKEVIKRKKKINKTVFK